MERQLWAAALVLATATTGAVAEERTVFRGETTVNVVEVPVRVYDSRTGEPIRGLARDDFRVLEDGREHPVTNFAEVARRGHPSEAAGPAAVDVVYFFDLYLMNRRDRDRALAGLRELYRDGPRADELVSVVSYDGELSSHLERSRDPEALEAALAAVAHRPGGLRGRVLNVVESATDGPIRTDNDLDVGERKQRSREFLSGLRARVDRVGAALSATMDRFAASDGRRVLVAFTPGHPETEWAPSYSPARYFGRAGRDPVHAMWDELALEAAQLGFTCYLLDPSGVRVGDRFQAAYSTRSLALISRVRGDVVARGEAQTDSTTGRRSRPDVSEPLTGWLERSRRDLLLATADVTGGAVVFGADVAAALQAVQASLDHYYSLAFVPDHSGDGRTHQLRVEVPGREHVAVEHRRAYVDQPPSVRREQRLKAAMMFGVEDNPLAVRVRVGSASGRRTVRVPLELRIPYAELALVDRGDMYWGKLLVTFFNQSEAGTESRMTSLEQPILLAADRYRKAVAEGYFSYKVTLEVGRGDHDLYIGVRDLVGDRTSLLPQQLVY